MMRRIMWGVIIAMIMATIIVVRAYAADPRAFVPEMQAALTQLGKVSGQ